jgi:phage baseplate assembly protein W
MSGFVDFPYHFDGLGLTASTSLSDHVRDLIEQVLFTSPGERVMRPDFGSGIMDLVFEPNSTALAGTTQMLVQGALHQYLSHLIAVQDVEVENIDSSLVVTVRYVLLADRSAQQASFTVPGVGP